MNDAESRFRRLAKAFQLERRPYAHAMRACEESLTPEERPVYFGEVSRFTHLYGEVPVEALLPQLPTLAKAYRRLQAKEI